VNGTPEVPSDPAEPVDSYPDSHLLLPFASLMTCHAHHNTGQ
jgi:hypothetical protein